MALKIPVYLVFGPQGSGKSTQAELLAEHLKLPFFDSGEQLRFLANGHDPLGEQIRQLMIEGQLVPNAILRRIFQQFLSEQRCTNGLVIDGFPRTLEQAKLLEELTKEHDWELVVIFVDITEETAKTRLLNRHTLVGGKKVVREDDQPAIVTKRLAVFQHETLPVIEQLSARGRYYKIDGEPNRQTVFNSIKKALR